MATLKSNLAGVLSLLVGVGLGVLGGWLLVTVADTVLLSAFIFSLNAGLVWCGGYAYLGLVKTLGYALLTSTVLRAIRVVRRMAR